MQGCVKTVRCLNFICMASFMIDIELQGVFNDDFFQLIPAQREYINRLLKKGVIVNYSLSADRKKLWVTMNASSQGEVQEIVDSFPIRKYLRYQIYTLLFHESSEALVPHLWLN